MTVTRIEYPAAPTTTAIKGTLLDIVSPGNAYAWGDGTALFESFNCGVEFGTSVERCAVVNKDLDQGGTFQSGALFHGYGGLRCKMIGVDDVADHLRENAARVFARREHFVIEQGLMKNRFIEGPTLGPTGPIGLQDDPLWSAPLDITPGGAAVAPAVAVGLLEAHAAQVYAGAPTLHLPRALVGILLGKGVLEFNGSSLVTKLGSKVAAGGGYDLDNAGPDGLAAAAGERWLYATGEVSVERSEFILRDAVDLPNNDVYVLAERGYLVAVDCYAAAIASTLED